MAAPARPTSDLTAEDRALEALDEERRRTEELIAAELDYAERYADGEAILAGLQETFGWWNGLTDEERQEHAREGQERRKARLENPPFVPQELVEEEARLEEIAVEHLSWTPAGRAAIKAEPRLDEIYRRGVLAQAERQANRQARQRHADRGRYARSRTPRSAGRRQPATSRTSRAHAPPGAAARPSRSSGDDEHHHQHRLDVGPLGEAAL